MADSMRRVIVATGNPGKLVEIRAALAIPGWEFVSPADLGKKPLEVEESGETFTDNAYAKALAYRDAFGLPALADDSGLVVDALGGRPGVRSARFAGDHASDADNTRKLMEELDGFGPEMRSARFQCSVVFVSDDKKSEPVSACGLCEGQIGFTPRGTNGFGYDPVFLPEEAAGLSMAELDMRGKSAISHRGKALRALKEELLGDAEK
jgi:XTP/dITP diphosphohydrolase